MKMRSQDAKTIFHNRVGNFRAMAYLFMSFTGYSGRVGCCGTLLFGNISAIGSEFRAFVSAMGRFNKAKAVPAPSVSRGSEVPVKPLQELVGMEPLPLGGVSTLGRVVYQFGFSTGRLALVGSV